MNVYEHDSDNSPAHLNSALESLRSRAERRKYLVTHAGADQSPQEIQKLVQELQVHQIELEMQYEELLQAQAEAQSARAQYVDLYDFAPVGYFTLSEAGLIQQLNLCGSQLLGTVRQRLVERRFALFVAPRTGPNSGSFWLKSWPPTAPSAASSSCSAKTAPRSTPR
ncbi:hypothetical protein ACFQT0_22320 [Hymenobacter humi]|uniref:PAS domain-containing protein n=1 Tax=Hymenobacter humi TaxID=1411620 RepID=A0ABW2U8H9_9BACT